MGERLTVFIVHFLMWTLLLYWIHRIGHSIPIIKDYHFDHHKFVLTQLRQGKQPTAWHWNNMFLFNDTWRSTIDLWITEVLPSLLYSWVTGQWWIIIFYYLWASLLQESIEHNPNIDIPMFTSGKWHLIHHYNGSKNFGLFFPWWDKLFGSYVGVER